MAFEEDDRLAAGVASAELGRLFRPLREIVGTRFAGETLKLALVRRKNTRPGWESQHWGMLGRGVESVGVEHQRLGESMIQRVNQPGRGRGSAEARAQRDRGCSFALGSDLVGVFQLQGIVLNVAQPQCHGGRLEGGDRRLDRSRHGESHQAGTTAQRRHARQGRGARHAERAADHQHLSVVALVAVGNAGGQLWPMASS